MSERHLFAQPERELNTIERDARPAASCRSVLMVGTDLGGMGGVRAVVRGYIDGGLFSPTNADLASGYASVVIVAPTLGQRDEVGEIFARTIHREEADLRNKGARVLAIAPDPASLAAFGSDLGDSRRRMAAAEAGRLQGRSLTERLRPLWKA